MNVNLLVVDCDNPASDWQTNLRAAILATNKRLYVYFQGEAASRALDVGILALLARYYNEVADLRPCLDLVPLFPFASWSIDCAHLLQPADRVALLEDLQGILGKCQQGQSRQLTQDLNYRRAGELPPVLLHPLQASDSAQSTDFSTTPQNPTDPASAIETTAHEGPLLFSNTAVGGTFDRLHAGHRILLAATALASTSMVFVGVTSDLLLQNKQHAELLQSYDNRTAAAVQFITAVRPGLNVQTAALRDPNEPTGAATISQMEAIVVSRETIKGANEINAWRAEHGSRPLTVVVVDLIGNQGSSGSNKLSSTRLRQEEAQNPPS